MDKLWIVLLFLGVFLIGSNIVKKLMIRFMNSADNQSALSAMTAEKEDPKVFWAEEGMRRDFEQAEYELPKEDFFESEKTEFAESFEEEFINLSEEEIKSVLEEADLFEKEGEAE
ncbi:MAG: hypothetical protein IJ306_07725 [Oscillospiraceae bacterium]|nr:hypothetical protein [Oscillospiraceae bacterium]